MGNHLYEYTQLTITGDLNGDDLRCLRTMAGRDINEETTEGKLADINLADAHIVAGGGDFGPYHRHTEIRWWARDSLPNAISSATSSFHRMSPR